MRVNAVLSTLFAVAASGAAVKPRDAASYDVFGFSADCTPHSVTCGYGFRVVPSFETPSDNGYICGNIVLGPDNLPPLPLTACFTNPDFAYSIDIANGGLTLTITSALNANTNLTGTHTATSDQFIFENGGTTISQRYIGPKNFTIVAEEVAV
ncbi:hypothetical protein F5B22DRAFT_565722 [Xylaria bambusicola]|uniref:uncharacterized protein n=1 Tax=Xylaria bambusicola TaxID=326684 RepID=UPI0020087010|nr:uncharacterized protein F5B22DRAFT_565722 [Xylaria bambusicola]KAI0521195.1 hypothetical protein F5B22DRAFT_565722 [Xylaria bambusicola]